MGIQVFDYSETDLSIEGNAIVVSGYCETDDTWADVSGVELVTVSASVTGNTICVTNTNEAYSDDFCVAGICCYNSVGSNGVLDIENNSIFTNGHYAVGFRRDGDELTVTGNLLVARQSGGNDAVHVESNSGTVTIADNTGALAAPVISPEAGTYASATDVTISCETKGTVIHYTVNGDDPTLQSEVYTQPIHLSETTTVKAFAAVEGFRASADVTAVYTLFPPFGTASFTMPAALRTIMASAFEGDTSITVVEIPSGCQKISADAFKGCTGLTQIRIPASVTSIDTTAFDGCVGVFIYGTADSAAQTFCADHANCTFVAEN